MSGSKSDPPVKEIAPLGRWLWRGTRSSLYLLFAFVCFCLGSRRAQAAEPYAVLHLFGGTVTNAGGAAGPDGTSASSPVTFDSSGNMYGTTEYGGQNNEGMVWEMTTSGTYKDLHDFGGTVKQANGVTGADGSVPFAAVTFDGAGDMFGTTLIGGAYGYGNSQGGAGIVWEITKAGTYLDIHDFGGEVINASGTLGPDGSDPWSSVTFDKNRNMYGTTAHSGPNSPEVDNGSGAGMAWEITSSGISKDLHDFGGTTLNANGSSGPDGCNPYAGVALDSLGDLYGTTQLGGANYPSMGTVWEITASGAYKDLHDFGGTVTTSTGISGHDGSQPQSMVAIDGAGNLYGTANWGGAYGWGSQFPYYGYGMIWEITPSGKYLDRHDFGGEVTNAGGASTADGCFPFSGVMFDSSGNMYGTTLNGGPNTPTGYDAAAGIVWELSNSGTYTDLHDFGGTVTGSSGTIPDGYFPKASVTVDSFGNLYGTTSAGASAETNGSVWIIAAGAQLASVTVNPASVLGGAGTTGAVKLTAPAPAGGVEVAISSSSTSATMQSSVTVPKGATLATFPVKTQGVGSTVTATITGILGTSTKAGQLVVEAPALSAVSVSTTSVVGGSTAMGTVTLASSAPTGGLTVDLSSSLSSATVPSSVTVLNGQKTAKFSIETKAVASNVTTSIVAKAGGVSKSASLEIEAATLSKVSVSPTSVVGGTSSTGTVTLTGPAPTAGFKVSLSSSSSSGSAPSSVTVASGKTTATFSVKTTAVATPVSATITAKLGSISKTATLKIEAPELTEVMVSPSSVVGSSSTTVTGTVTFNGPAASAGETVSLSSSNPSVVSVASSVKVSGGASTATFKVKHFSVSTTQTVTLTAVCGSITKTVKLTLTH